MFGIGANRAEALIQASVEKVVRDALAKAETTLATLNERAGLLEQCEQLKIEKSRREEEFARKEREIEHKVGLERARQEQELQIAKREVLVSAKEENLVADKERFESQMEFHEKRFTEEVTYLKEMVGQVLKRLPSAEMFVERKV